MVAAYLLLGVQALTFAPSVADSETSFVAFPPEELVDVVEARAPHMLPPLPRPRSKKETWLAEKATRPNFHLADRQVSKTLAAASRLPLTKPRFAVPGSANARRALSLSLPGLRVQPLTTLFNLWTREALPILPGQTPDDRLHPFLRDHYTNQATHMDTRLIEILARVATRFSADRIDVVSGYRSPKYNLMLRKKGREVARQSQHPEGTAVDFRVRGVPIKTVVQYVRSLRRGGVGYYPNSQFVHSDTGRVRYWTGT